MVMDYSGGDDFEGTQHISGKYSVKDLDRIVMLDLGGWEDELEPIYKTVLPCSVCQN
jgi:hypothetical protein